MVNINENTFIEEAQSFISNILEDIQNEKLITCSHQIDHICYRVESQKRYNEMKSFLEKFSVLLIETPINGRDIATYKLHKPIKVADYSIELIELPSPKKGSSYQEGFEHLEMVINKDISFDDLIEKNPKFSFHTKDRNKKVNPDISVKLSRGKIKFHHQSLEDIIKEELKSL